MLSVYARHSADCPRSDDGIWKRCKCPKWVWGTLNGEFVRRSAKTRGWEHAEEFRRNLEQLPIAVAPAASAFVLAESVRVLSEPQDQILPPQKKRSTIKFAVEKYLADAKSRDLAANNFRATWTDGALVKSKKQDRLIGFFWSCIRRGYITQNPTLEIGKIKVIHVPTDYFPRDEFNKIVDSTYVYGDPRGGFIPLEDLRLRLRAMTLLMRWSGLRIRDAVTLEKTRLHGKSLFLYQAQTGTPVFVPLPPYVVKTLNELPPGPNQTLDISSGVEMVIRRVPWRTGNGRSVGYLKLQRSRNWTGRRSVATRTCSAIRSRLKIHWRVFQFTKSRCCWGTHPSKSQKKSYAPFVKARQLQLQDSVRNAWQIAAPEMAKA